MNILVIGSKYEFDIIQQKLGVNQDYTFVEDASLALKYFEEQDMVFDFLIEEYPDNLDAYKDIEGLKVFLNIPKLSLAELQFVQDDINCRLFGFNGIPGFLENEKWEISLLDEKDKEEVMDLFQSLNNTCFIVADRVGMVTPRVVSMIINEAFFTVQEGTASMEDIDLGMKLGTNYPYGPFEWLEKIGVRNVYELLEALYDDTKDERYKVAPLLKRKYLLETGHLIR